MGAAKVRSKSSRVSPNAVSKHLKVLEKAGLIRRGRDHVLNFEAEPLREILDWVHPYEKFWNQRLDRLEDFFVERKKKK
jgi:DNA-binding transcriptional ArsR family regulator